MVIVVGLADPKRECWVLAGFEPGPRSETRRLAGERKNLGFDPRERADRLTAAKPGAKRNAKRVLDVLTAGDLDRQAQCLEDVTLDLLAKRGASTGLADYLEELRLRLLPILAR